MVHDGCGAHGHGVAGLGNGQLCNCSDISGLQLRHLDLLLAAQHVQLADLLLHVLVHVVDNRVAL